MTIGDTYPHWIFDGSELADPFGYGAQAVEFLRRLKHPKSRLRKNAFQLDPWQERIVMAIYGPRHVAELLDGDGMVVHRRGDRIVSEVFLLLPRGSRKTSLSAALALLHVFGPEAVPNGEILFAAGDRAQAGIGFKEALGIVRADRRMSSKTRIHDSHNSVKRLAYADNGAFLEAISADGKLQHGRTPAFVLADEIHIWPDRELWDALTSGLDKSSNTLLVVATTAGRGETTLAFERIDYARKVARGEIVNPSILPVLFEAPKDCDWRDEALWHRVNPGLKHGYPSLAGFRNRAKLAENSPAELDSFRQLKLNEWLSHSASPFVDMAIYDQGAAPVDLEALRGRRCWLGVDLSSNSDLTVISAVWRADDGDGYVAHPWFFCPADNLDKRAKADGVPYPQWAKDGFITPTPGNVVDFRVIEAKVRQLCLEFDVAEIAFDPALARNMMATLGEDGLPVVEHRQTPLAMTGSIVELERAILAGKFQHGGHPILRWNFENIATKRFETGVIQFLKNKSKDRIDGAMATAMAIGRASVDLSVESIFDDPDALADIYKRHRS
ncbi:MAG: terminase large subunit [Allorhizobium sp.]